MGIARIQKPFRVQGQFSQRVLDEASQQSVACSVGCEYGHTGENRERSTEPAVVRRGIGIERSVLTRIAPKDNAGVPSAHLRIRLRREALARHGLDESDVLDTIEAIGGKPVGEIVEGNRRFTMQVRFPQEQRKSADAISNLRVGDGEGHFIPLAQLADIEDQEGPAQISRENGQRRISVGVNVRGRDLAGFVADAQKAVAAKVKIPSEYQLEWGGQFEQLESASQRLMIVVPAALTLIFVLLYLNFQAALPALLIFLNIPLAATGALRAACARNAF
jgi:cobalt-zinc-cadmium resistance protein CzcA